MVERFYPRPQGRVRRGHIDDFKPADATTYTKQSFGEARQQIRPEAFTELNTAFVNPYYDDEEYRTFRGFRVLAIDASSKPLPDSPLLRAEYGGATGKGPFSVAKARASPLYDVLNGIVVDARIAPLYGGARVGSPTCGCLSATAGSPDRDHHFV